MDSDRNNNEGCRSPKTLVLDNVNVLSDVSNSQFPALSQERLQTVKLKDCTIYDSILMSILRQLPGIEEIELKNVVLRKNVPAPSPKVVCFQARRLVFEGSDLDVLDTIWCPNLEEFRIALTNIRPHHQLMTFISQHTTVTTLEIHAVGCDIMNFFEIIPDLTLKTLSLVGTDFDGAPGTAHENNLLRFLKAQVKSLRTLEIKANVTKASLDFMLRHFRMLKCLELKVNQLPQAPTFYTIKRPRKSIKELILTGPFIDLNTIVSIVMLYPAITSLHLVDHSFDLNYDFVCNALNNVLLHVTEICKDLRSLRLARMPSFAKQPLKFKSLQSLQVAYVNDIRDITKLVAENPTIETLTIDFVFRHQATASFLSALVHCGIKHLSICAEPVEIRAIHDFFMLYKGGIEVLVLKCQVKARMKTYEFRFSQEVSNAITSDTLADDVNFCLLQELVQYLDEL